MIHSIYVCQTNDVFCHLVGIKMTRISHTDDANLATEKCEEKNGYAKDNNKVAPARYTLYRSFY